MAKGNIASKNESKVGKRGKTPMTPDRIKKIERKKKFTQIAEAAKRHKVLYSKMAETLGITTHQFNNIRTQKNTSFPDLEQLKLMELHYGVYADPNYTGLSEGEF